MNASVVCLGAVAALLFCEWRELRGGAALAKTLASAAFLAAAWEFGAFASDYGRVVAVGLLLCALGDVLLIPRGDRRVFLAGMGAFLLGHAAYCVAFVGTTRPDATAMWIAFPPVLGAAWLALRWLRPHLEGVFLRAVPVYVSVISMMVVCAVGAARGDAPTIAAAGAIGFAVSDVAVARNRFATPGFANGAWGLPLYYVSQLLIAASVATFA